jgi:sigma-B regulation protein RsbU (phosphoserine phosphatase)
MDDRIGEDLWTARILIIDDNDFMRGIIAAHLRKDGFLNIAQADDGAQGLEAARSWHPELIITDLLTPNVDGFELCRRLRGDIATMDIPILVATGMDETGDRAEVFSAGATDLVIKPLNSRELLARVRIHIERRRLIERLSEFRRHMGQEMDQARAMQESLLPSQEDVRRLEGQYPIALASHFETSSGIGGDMWGIRAVDKTRLSLFSVDFAGHGVGAALNTFRLHSYTSGVLGQIDDAAKWLGQANQFLCEVLPVGQFATAFCAVIDFSTGALEYAAAAAPSNLVLSAGTRRGFQPIDGTGFPLGVTPEAVYENRIVGFGPGSKLLLFSDALVETPDPIHPVFTTEKLRTFLNARQRETRPEAVQGALLAKLRAEWPAKPGDDLTIVTLHRAGSG